MDSTKKLPVYGSICINGRGEVLLVHGCHSEKWSFPKGHLEKYDATPIACAKRELMEETGIEAPDTYISCHRLQAATYYLFVVKNDYVFTPKNPEEIDDVRWWSLTNLPKTNCNVDVSMFRTLMKSFQIHESYKEFLSSRFAESRLASIKQNMNRSVH
jgi:ADP-ribose pyrophosphatase YjhB (NUDIX family)